MSYVFSEEKTSSELLLKERVKELSKEKDVVILAHYYVDSDVQDVADFVGDSYYLAQKAVDTKAKNLLMCGVSFMGESAKILNPHKCVIMADEYADCPMAHMVDVDRIREVRQQYEDVAVVCYVNSTAEIKGESDVCVTSSNAIPVVKALSQRNIFFIPDNNLGRYVASKLPEKNFIFHDGFCHVHKSISLENVEIARRLHPEAAVLSHPECTSDVLEHSDFVGSTSEILKYATESKKNTFIICTEMGIFYELQRRNPEKKFYNVGHRQFCPNMKRITLEKVERALETMEPAIQVEESLRIRAERALGQMMAQAQAQTQAHEQAQEQTSRRVLTPETISTKEGTQ